MIIKICGLKEIDNILAVDRLSPGLIGLIFHEKSPRAVPDIILPPLRTPRVGVFVNAGAEQIKRLAEKYELSYIQLHGDESLKYIKSVRSEGYRVIKAVRIDSKINTEDLKPFMDHCEYLLFDTKGRRYGGTGTKFNWDLLDQYDLDMPFLLSGGIQPRDAARIKGIRHPAFAGIDINSGFEITPGIKNVELIEKFIDEIRN